MQQLNLACRRQDRLVWQAIKQVVLHEAGQLDVPQSEAQQLLAQVGPILKRGGSSRLYAVKRFLLTLDYGCPADTSAAALTTGCSLANAPCVDVQLHDGRSAQQQALRAAVLSMFADNQAAVQRKPLLSSISISVPPPHNILRHIRSQLRHQAVRLAFSLLLEPLHSTCLLYALAPG